MEFKGFKAKVEFDDETELLHGEVIGIKDVVTFQARAAMPESKAEPCG